MISVYRAVTKCKEYEDGKQEILDVRLLMNDDVNAEPNAI